MPFLFVGLELFFGEEAVVEHGGKGVAIHVLADENDFLAAVAVFAFPNSINVSAIFGPVLTWNCCPEVSCTLVTTDCSCL